VERRHARQERHALPRRHSGAEFLAVAGHAAGRRRRGRRHGAHRCAAHALRTRRGASAGRRRGRGPQPRAASPRRHRPLARPLARHARGPLGAGAGGGGQVHQVPRPARPLVARQHAKPGRRLGALRRGGRPRRDDRRGRGASRHRRAAGRRLRRLVGERAARTRQRVGRAAVRKTLPRGLRAAESRNGCTRATRRRGGPAQRARRDVRPARGPPAELLRRPDPHAQHRPPGPSVPPPARRSSRASTRTPTASISTSTAARTRRAPARPRRRASGRPT
jgi:hypothetical protein